MLNVTLGDQTDEELLERYAQGDVQAFEEFFLRHRSRVYFYALKKLRRPEIAAELLQDVFLKLHAKIHLFRSGERALPWFFTLVHNACLDSMRKSAVYAHYEEASGVEAEVAVHSVMESFVQLSRAVGSDSLPSNSSDSDEPLAQSLSQLTPEQQQLLEQRIVHEKSFRTISDETGKQEATLRKIYSRAIEKMRKWLLTHSNKEDKA
jgi:RNA polymerase sigma-70 factor (ECF subfamily)